MLRLTTLAGATELRAFLNITSFGLAGLTDRIVNRDQMARRARGVLPGDRARPGRLAKPAVRVLVDGVPWLESPVVNVTIANGRYFGGGMQIAPDADPADGLFDVVAVGDLAACRRWG